MGVLEAPGTDQDEVVNHVQCAESPMLSSGVVVVYVQVTRIKLAPTCSLTLSARENVTKEGI